MTTDTPRTDAVIRSDKGDSGFFRDLAVLSRQLERELATALTIAEDRRIRALKTAAQVDKLKEIAEGLAYTGCPIHRGYWKSKLREPLAKPLR